MNVISLVHFEVGFDNARIIIGKATDSDLGPIEIPVRMDKDRTIAERTFSATRGKVRAKGNYDLRVKVCNPKC